METTLVSKEEMPVDLKNDILLSFNLYKDANNKIPKSKVRTILFTFVMYKSAASEINSYIEQVTSEDKEFFTYDEVCRLINFKLGEAKANEGEEIFTYMSGRSESNYLTESDMVKAFKNFELDVGEKEIKEMIKLITNTEGVEGKNPTKISKDQFMKFYV